MKRLSVALFLVAIVVLVAAFASAEEPTLCIYESAYPGITAVKEYQRQQVRVIGKVSHPDRMGVPGWVRGYEVGIDPLGRVFAFGRVNDCWIFVRPDAWKPMPPTKLATVTNWGVDVAGVAGKAAGERYPFPREQIIVQGDPSFNAAEFLPKAADALSGDAGDESDCRGGKCPDKTADVDPMELLSPFVTPAAIVLLGLGLLFFSRPRRRA